MVVIGKNVGEPVEVDGIAKVPLVTFPVVVVALIMPTMPNVSIVVVLVVFPIPNNY
jgi:hypothetical protein